VEAAVVDGGGKASAAMPRPSSSEERTHLGGIAKACSLWPHYLMAMLPAGLLLPEPSPWGCVVMGAVEKTSHHPWLLPLPTALGWWLK